MNRKQESAQINSEASPIRKITGNHYAVKSQRSDRTYNVRQLPESGVWTCECGDFHHRLRTQDDKHCKHIRSCIALGPTESQSHIEKVDPPRACPSCGSASTVKHGFRKLKNGTRRQMYRCKGCKTRFVLGENGFSRMTSDPKIISAALNKAMHGMSYRNIMREIETEHQTRISHVSVRNWIKKYTAMIKAYVDTLVPDVSDVWSLDEMCLNVKGTEETGTGFHSWLWSIIDPSTKFLIATEVSKKRTIADAVKIIASGRKVAGDPRYVMTDSLNSYRASIRKEFQNRVAHVPTKSIRDGFANRPVERWHNEYRENLKARRGLGNDESAQTFSDLQRIYHNFVRPHQGLDGRTPAEEAGIGLNLGNDKFRDLINLSANYLPTTESNYGLGKRVERVTVRNEVDSIKVTPRGWIGKDTWREINDILRRHRFVWLSDGKNGHWFRPSGTAPNFVSSLGRRISKVTIVREGNSTMVRPRGWLEKRAWREINDILRLHKFSWESDGKNGHWTKDAKQQPE